MVEKNTSQDLLKNLTVSKDKKIIRNIIEYVVLYIFITGFVKINLFFKKNLDGKMVSPVLINENIATALEVGMKGLPLLKKTRVST